MAAHTDDPASLTMPVRRSWPRGPVCALVLVALMAFSVFAHVGALERSLPLQDADEEFFVEPAVSIAASGDLNPHWFGHPGSTVIYPVAALIHGWDAVLHGGPVLGAHPALRARFASNPRPFYLIGRLWVIALAIATIPVVFALGRRAFNRRVGLIAAVLWTVLPYVIHFGRITRTESAATFFGLIALYCCVRAWTEPRIRWWLLAGLSVGLAVSSRYFMATLVPVLIAATLLPVRRNRRRALYATGMALLAGAAGFVLTTPYALLDLGTLQVDLTAEANVTHAVADGLSPVGNAWWYVSEAIPDALSRPIFIAALIGIVVIVVGAVRSRPRRGYRLMLLGYCGIFLVAISASQLHWQRWTIEILPVLVLFAAVAVDKAADLVAARSPERFHARVIVPAVVTLALVVVPVSNIRETNRYDAAPTTSTLAREWLQAHVRPGSRVAQTPDAFNLPPKTVARLGHGIAIDYQLDPTKPLSDSRRAGVDYVVIGTGAAYGAFLVAKQHPAQAAFYTELACKNRLVAAFGRRDSRVGFGISIYRLDRAPVKLLDLLCTQTAPARG